MREYFGLLLVCEVEMFATGLLWDAEVAAYYVTSRKTTKDERTLPRSANSFAYITVWVAVGSQSRDSNNLTELVEKGKTQRVEFQTAVSLCGKITFWSE